MKRLPPLLYADSERSADLLYFGSFHAPDAFIACELKGKKVALLNALEFGRGKKESSFDHVYAVEEWHLKAKKRWTDRAIGTAEIIETLASAHRCKRFVIPDDFPAGLAARLHTLGLELIVAENSLFPERELKSRVEAAHIKEGNRCAALGIAAAEKALRKSKIKNGFLELSGEKLTSQKLKFLIEVACLEAGALSMNTIAAGGDQACDPHCTGSGPLRANELIIVDVFPRVQSTGYHGDMTRTFLKGKANDNQRALVDAVATAQSGAIAAIKDGVSGRNIHLGVVQFFEGRGFKTERTEAGSRGFFHGTGHGLGLAIHELPRLSGAVESLLQQDAVVTVEPGLYYPGLGGCRIEDVVQVQKRGCRMLSDYPYEWELR